MRRCVVVASLMVAGCSAAVGGSGDPSGVGTGNAPPPSPTNNNTPPNNNTNPPNTDPQTCAALVEEPLAPSAIAWEGASPCAADGFCTVYPAPTGQIPSRIRAVTGAAAEGSTWAVSGDIVYAWNAATKTGRVHQVNVPVHLLAISPVNDSDVWAVGENEELAHWNGSTWTVTQLDKGSALSGVHARAANDVWTVGNFGVVGHFNGTSWSSVSLPGSPALSDVFAVSGTDVWAAEWNGGAWHFDGATWTKIASAGTKTFNGVWASGAGDAWFAGEAGILRGNATALAKVDVPTGTSFTTSFEGVWGSSAEDVWAVRTSDAFHLKDGVWKKEQIGSGENGFGGAHGITGRGANDMTAVGDTHVRSWNGNAWSDVFQVGFPAINGSWQSPNGDIWFVGAKGTILRAAHGTELRAMKTTATKESTTNLRAVWGSADGDIWFGGDHSSLFHLKDGQVCPIAHGAAARIRSMSGSSANDIWAAVDGPGSLHYDGTKWNLVTNIDEGYVQAFKVFSPTNAYAITKTLFHYDGVSWTEVPTTIPKDTMNSFDPVFGGTSASDVYVTGHVFLKGDKLLHFNGTSWEESESPSTNTDAITATSLTDVWMIDWGVHHLEGGAWKDLATFSRRNITTAVATPAAIWLAGSDGAIRRKNR